MGIASLMAFWFALSSLGVWLWVSVFQLPLGNTFVQWFEGLGYALGVLLGPFVPHFPMKGEDPEILAADEFFKGPRR